ncbi:MAG TPA: beta-propeller fold lactonase family protein, partial [Pyrinomonadaceae bacterium]|nr:beta-propeller fold lactonase family protein [Pyrinomonadaceae bacterium]
MTLFRSVAGNLILILASILLPSTVLAQSTYVNFEGAQTNPVRLSPDGTRLFAVNTPDARLSVFDLSQPSNPSLIAEIPVGIEPVSVNPRTNDEVWVVNQVSDSISIVSVSKGIVTDTIHVKDEPADVVFAGNQLAFVTVSRSNEVRAFDLTTHALVASIPLLGHHPRALAVSPDGKRIYAAFALSGNRTTIIPASDAPPQPSPTNRKLPPPPQVGLIVDATDPTWAPSHIKYTMPDNDVVEINTQTLTVTRYFSRVGTVNLGIAVRPTTGDLFVANTDARNLVRFEPNLRGHFVDNRITRIAIAGGTVTPFDLNPTINYNVLPNPSAKAIALAQPTAVVFEPSGSFMYVAAFGTDRVARVGVDGSVLKRIEIGSATGSSVDPRNMRGPRGLALNANTNRLYVLNRISNSVSVVDTTTDSVLRELPVGSFDPTPLLIRSGRGFLYDAKLSGNGTASCAACHIDSDMDFIAWDLGNPGGQMQTVNSQGVNFQMHPMKGPMTTQTLRGLSGLEPLHWRGDRANFLAFNPAFDALMGGAQLSSADMAAFRDFINTIRFQPNPNQNLDRTLPSSFAGGDPNAGRNTFINEPFTGAVTCNSCHVANPGTGTNRAIISASLLQESQPFKVPHLRNLYQKNGFNKAAGATSIIGFGFIHDGSLPDLITFLSQPVFQKFSNDTVRKANLNAFLQCFDTGMAPAVGYTRTMTAGNVNNSAVFNDWTLLQNQAGAGNIDLVIKGTVDGLRMGLLYQPASNNYRTDKTGFGPFTQAQLKTKILAGDTLTVMGVPPGSGTRMGIDRDLDGALDGDSVVTHTISGQVTSGGIGLGGVTLTLSGSQSGTATTDGSGNYTFMNLTEGGNYTLTPSKTGYVFNPSSRTF